MIDSVITSLFFPIKTLLESRNDGCWWIETKLFISSDHSQKKLDDRFCAINLEFASNSNCNNYTYTVFQI